MNHLNTLYSNALGETSEIQSSAAEQHLSSFWTTTISDLHQHKNMIQNEISTLWHKCPDSAETWIMFLNLTQVTWIYMYYMIIEKLKVFLTSDGKWHCFYLCHKISTVASYTSSGAHDLNFGMGLLNPTWHKLFFGGLDMGQGSWSPTL